VNITPSAASASEPAIYLDGSTEPKTYEFAGPDFTPFTITGCLVPGHTRAGDPDAPVIVRQGDVIEPGAAQTIDLRCASCTASVSLGPMDGHTLAVIEHEERCPAFRRLLAEALS